MLPQVSYGSDNTLAAQTESERSVDRLLMLGSGLFAGAFMAVRVQGRPSSFLVV